MRFPLTLKIFLAILGVYGLLLLPVFWSSSYVDAPLGFIALFPILSVYLFHQLGIPELLEHNGACGWGWCAPTLFGYTFLTIFWLGMLWLLSWALAKFLRRSSSNK